MKKIDYITKFNNVTKNKELVEISFHGNQTYTVAYILGVADQYLLFAEVNSSGTLAGITICKTEDIDSISLETIYISELVKQIPGHALFDQAMKTIVNVKENTFDGFILAFENTKTIVEVTTDDENTFAGRLVEHSDRTLVLDEYSSEMDRCLGHVYFNRSIVTKLSIDVPWLRIIARSLAGKNL